MKDLIITSVQNRSVTSRVNHLILSKKIGKSDKFLLFNISQKNFYINFKNLYNMYIKSWFQSTKL